MSAKYTATNQQRRVRSRSKGLMQVDISKQNHVLGGHQKTRAFFRLDKASIVYDLAICKAASLKSIFLVISFTVKHCTSNQAIKHEVCTHPALLLNEVVSFTFVSYSHNLVLLASCLHLSFTQLGQDRHRKPSSSSI